MGRIPHFITCPSCGQVAIKHYAKGLCKSCYTRQKPKYPPTLRICRQCGRVRKMQTKNQTLCGICSFNAWKTKHPEYKKIHAEREKKWRAEHPEENSARETKRSQNPKRIAWQKKYTQEYYQKHRKELCEYQSRWRREHPKQRDHYKKRRMARVLGLPDTLTLEEWDAILEQYNHSCAYCQTTGVELVKDHLVPASKGGGFTAENIVPACTSCNCSKSDVDATEFILSRKAKRPHPLLLTRLSILH